MNEITQTTEELYVREGGSPTRCCRFSISLRMTNLALLL